MPNPAHLSYHAAFMQAEGKLPYLLWEESSQILEENVYNRNSLTYEASETISVIMDTVQQLNHVSIVLNYFLLVSYYHSIAVYYMRGDVLLPNNQFHMIFLEARCPMHTGFFEPFNYYNK